MPDFDRNRPANRLNRLRRSLMLEQLEERTLMSAASFQAIPHVGTISPAAIITQNNLMAPAQMKMAYGISSLPQQGQGMTVAIVDAFDSPNILNDVNVFSTQFGLPQMNAGAGTPTFTKVTPPGQAAPVYNSGWAVEIGLDVEWVHAIAPRANIVLVETQDNGGDSLFGAEVDAQPYQSGVFYAKNLPGVSVVTNSYGGGEFAGESAYDVEFASPNVAVTVSTGDSSANGEYPAYASTVIAVGGTRLYTLSGRGAYGIEYAWGNGSAGAQGGGGGVSLGGVLAPTFQTNNGVNYGARATPDVSMDADPASGALVYYSAPIASPGFYSVGGTSLSSPMMAALITLADQARGGPAFNVNSVGINNAMYAAYNSGAYSTDFHDVTIGSNGYPATAGYDLATGIGTPKAAGFVNLMLGASSAASLGGQVGNGVPGGVSGVVMGSNFNHLIGAAPMGTATTPANMMQTVRLGGTSAVMSGAQVVSATAAGANRLFPTATVVAAEMPVVTETTAAVEDTGATLVSDAVILPAGTMPAAVVDSVFAVEPAVAAPATKVTVSETPVVSDDAGSADLALAAGMALALTGSWSSFSQNDTSRKRMIVNV